MQNKSITTKTLYFILSFWFTLNSSAYVATGNPTACGLYPKEGITCAANYINGIYVEDLDQAKQWGRRDIYCEIILPK